MESIFNDKPLRHRYELPDDDPTPISDLTYDEIQQKLKEQKEKRNKLYNLVENYWAWDTDGETYIITELRL